MKMPSILVIEPNKCSDPNTSNTFRFEGFEGA